MTIKFATRSILGFACALAILSCARAKLSDTNSAGDSDLADSFGVQSSKGKVSKSSSDQTTISGQASGDDFASQQGVARSDLLPISDALKSGSESKLMQAASAILSRDPNQLETLNALAVFYYRNKKYGMAEILLKRALKTHPNEPALYNNLGVVYLAESEMQPALESFNKALRLKPGYRIAATNLSSIYLDYRDYSRGLAPLEQSYNDTQTQLEQGAPNAVAIANNYAVALMGIGNAEKAQGVFNEILRSNQQNPIPVLNDAILLVEVLKKKNDAIRVISKLKFMTEDASILRRASALEQEVESLK